MKKLFSKIGILLLITMILGCTDGGGASSPTQPTTVTIADETRKVEAGQYWAKMITLPRGAKVSGRVTVEEYDIDFYLLKGEREYMAFENGDTFYKLEGVGGKNVKSIPISFTVAEEDVYYFIASNINSLMTAKYVEMSITATY